MASGCSAAVEHMPLNETVMGSNSAKCWDFSSSSFSQQSILKQVFCGGAIQLIFQEKLLKKLTTRII